MSRLPVCEECVSALRPLHGSFCHVCGEALLSPAFMDRANALCGLCQRVHPPFERAVAYGGYDGGLRDLIHLLKYQQVRPAVSVLGRMLAEVMDDLESTLPKGAIAVVPVPLHSRKQRQRGFNQAELIARSAMKHLAQRDRFEVLTDVLVRSRETGSQIGLTRHQRRANLRGAFTVTTPKQVAERKVVLVDDVYTTGTTASECARVLKRAGVDRVWVATVARTLKISEMFVVPQNLDEARSEVRLAVANS
jgi:ComF family protein